MSKTASDGATRDLSKVRSLVVKVGSSSLTAADGGLDEAQVHRLAAELGRVRRKGISCVLVSSGAIAAGLAPLGLKRRPTDIPSLQAAASVGQGVLMHSYQRAFARRKMNVGQVLLTQDDFIRRKGYLNARAALNRLLALGVVPIVNENDTVAVEEIRFGDNDRLAALVANLVHADLLVILSDVEGVHASDPSRGGGTEVIDQIEDLAALPVQRSTAGSHIGSGGIVSKIEAAKIATASGVGVVVANGRRENVLADVLAGRRVGTYVPPRALRGPSRKLWIAFAQTPRGAIVVDDGARRALVEGGKSLLPAGVVGHRGRFAAGDAVEVETPDGVVFAKGLVNYASDEVDGVRGRSIRGGGREIIHRDSLVIL
ncbi:MAG: glutamate 5-kinase [Actinomycetota bacterium]